MIEKTLRDWESINGSDDDLRAWRVITPVPYKNCKIIDELLDLREFVRQVRQTARDQHVFLEK